MKNRDALTYMLSKGGQNFKLWNIHYFFFCEGQGKKYLVTGSL